VISKLNGGGAFVSKFQSGLRLTCLTIAVTSQVDEVVFALMNLAIIEHMLFALVSKASLID
jgi:hypothetical protein